MQKIIKNNMDKQKEFNELYMKWYSSYMFSAFGGTNPASKEYYDNLKEWCKENKKESLQYIKEMLEYEPSDIVMVLQDLYADKLGIKIEGFMPLQAICNLWLNILNKEKGLSKGKIKDYYKSYDKYKAYIDKNYIPWRPNLEDDPNITREEFENGKRNNKKNMKHKWHDFSLNILKDDELEKLYNEGHLGDMTKHIQELHFFFNRVEEEIKRRKIKI